MDEGRTFYGGFQIAGHLCYRCLVMVHVWISGIRPVDSSSCGSTDFTLVRRLALLQTLKCPECCILSEYNAPTRPVLTVATHVLTRLPDALPKTTHKQLPMYYGCWVIHRTPQVQFFCVQRCPCVPRPPPAPGPVAAEPDF